MVTVTWLSRLFILDSTALLMAQAPLQAAPGLSEYRSEDNQRLAPRCHSNISGFLQRETASPIALGKAVLT
jgi:hypothetical protein